MTFTELKSQLLSLTPAEKAEVIQLLSQSLANTWQGINKTPGVMGGDACIRQTRIPVWLLVSYQRSGLSEAKILDNYPSLSAIDARKCLVLCSSIRRARLKQQLQSRTKYN